MKRLICRLIKLDELKPVLGFSILELTPREQEKLAEATYPSRQLRLWDD